MRCKEIRSGFPTQPIYNRFIELQERAILPVTVLAKIFAKYASDGVCYIDSFSLKVSHQRISSHKVVKGLAALDNTSVRWVFGLSFLLW
ncbi:hypothetical protein H0X06_03275 [Candidatus Dependentiae bacterium]|nr:hypothetical protein [Candidatus Dependentiae bacterium]